MLHKPTYEIFENIISEEESQILSKWVLENNKSSVFINTTHPGTIRRTTRTNVIQNIKYPKTAYDIQLRINNILKKYFNLDSLIYSPKYTDGMYFSIGFRGDYCEPHIDPIYIKNTITYHFNIILSEYENGKLIIDNDIVELNKLDGILYPVSELKHSTTKLTGTNPRIFCCFGYCIPLPNNKILI